MLVGLEPGAIDSVDAPVEVASGGGVGRHCRQESFPDPSSLPAVEATRHRAPRATTVGQRAPGRPGAQNPEDAVENATMLDSWAADRGGLWGEPRLQPLPLPIAHVSSVQTHQYNALNSVCKHTLVQTKSVHIRLVHSGSDLCLFLSGDSLHPYGHCGLIVEV